MTLASLCKASKNGHIKIVRFLILLGANMISPNGDTALTSAIKAGHLDIAKLLIVTGKDILKELRIDTLNSENQIFLILKKYNLTSFFFFLMFINLLGQTLQCT